jgi:hypothetical protein
MEKRAKAKADKAKDNEQNALLGFLLKNAKKFEEEKAAAIVEGVDQADDKVGDINLYADPRPPNPDRSAKMCDNFLNACEDGKYGWGWRCPNGNDVCLYTHALPEGYMLQSTMKALQQMEREERGDRAIEY